MTRRIPPWTVAVVVSALLATAAFAGGEAWVDALVADRRWAQPWRLLTGPLVHADADHLLRDLPIFAALSWALERKGRSFPALLALALAVPTAAVLLLQPGFAAYGGLSGAINALLVVFVAGGWASAGPHGRMALGLLGAAHGGKLLYEGLTGQLLFPMEVAGGAAAPLAHLVGAAVGVGWLLVEGYRRSLRNSTMSSPSSTYDGTRATSA